MFKHILLSKHWQAAVVSCVSFLVYLKTLAPTVTFIDSGELATVACTLGIAHPTGYPLFTLLGWVFSKLPIASQEIVRLNIMAAFLCAAGLFIFYHLVHFLLGLVARQVGFYDRKDGKTMGVAIAAASAGSTFLLAFSETYWSQAVSVEVYSLHVVFLSLVTFCFLKAIYGGGEDESGIAKSQAGWWMLFAFTLGLSFTNHMTTILLAPGLLFLYFATQGNSLESWKRIGVMVGPFILGLSAYLYLPIRASQSPLLNWGNVVTPERFLWHLSGKQYRVWIFSSTEAAGRQLKYFLSSLPVEFAYVGLAAALVGCIVLWKANRKLFVSSLLLFFGCLFYSINYDIHDIDSYFLLAYLCVALWSGCGFLRVCSWLTTKTALRLSVVSSVVVLVGIAPCFVHYQRNDESANFLVEDYTMNMFNSLQPNALIISYQWDYWLSASYYFQIVKGVRPDVIVVDKELLRRSWYLTELENRYPWLIENSRVEVEAFKKELFKFEHELPYNPAVIEGRYVGMITSFIDKNLNERPVYVTNEIEHEFTQGLQRVPEGLAFRVYEDSLYHVTSRPTYTYRPLGRAGRLEDMVKTLYASSFLARGRYYQSRANDMGEMREALRSALFFDPTSMEVHSYLRGIGVQRIQ